MLRNFMLLLGLALTLVAAPVSHAQRAVENWPERPITLIVPAPPGGSTDTLIRALADGLSAQLGQTVVVESRSGATGTIALQALARAPDDGYTFVTVYPSMLISTQFTFKDLPFNAKRDFRTVAGVAFAELVMSVNAAVPVNNPQEFIAWLKAQPKGRLTYGSYGETTYGHMAGHYLSTMYDLDAVHIPYKGEQPMLLAMASNDISYGITSASPAQTMRDTGKTRIIGVLSDRAVLNPGVSTFMAAGITDPVFQLLPWYGLLARKSVPDAIVNKMEAAVLAVLDTPKMQERLAAITFLPWKGATAKAFEETWFREIPLYYNLLRMTGAEIYE